MKEDCLQQFSWPEEGDWSNGEKGLTNLPCAIVCHLFWELGWDNPFLREEEHSTEVGGMTDTLIWSQVEV